MQVSNQPKTKRQTEVDMTTKPEPHWFTSAEAAESLGIAPRTFRSWSVDPVAEIGRTRYFTAEAILENRLADLQCKSDRPATALDELKREVDSLETDLIRMRAKRQELRNAELRGELVSTASITMAISQAATACGAILDPLPGKMRRQIVTLSATDIQRVRSIIVHHQNRIASLPVDVDSGSCDSER